MRSTLETELPSSRSFSAQHPIFVKSVKINLFDMNEKHCETVMGYFGYLGDDGRYSSNLDLTPGKGRSVGVTFSAQLSLAFTTRLEVMIVDAFGHEHPLAQTGVMPFPFQRFKG
jgi:hypothetical protein